MKKKSYLLDTHALIFWSSAKNVSKDFIAFFDKQDRQGNLFISSLSFWEAALLAKKGRIKLADVEAWKKELLSNSNLTLIEPTVSEMIESTLLPDHHKDPFDRLLIVQANHHHMLFVTKDSEIKKYSVRVFWL